MVLSSSKGRSVYSDIRKKSKSVRSFKTRKSSKTVNTMSDNVDTSSVSNFFLHFDICLSILIIFYKV